MALQGFQGIIHLTHVPNMNQAILATSEKLMCLMVIPVYTQLLCRSSKAHGFLLTPQIPKKSGMILPNSHQLLSICWVTQIIERFAVCHRGPYFWCGLHIPNAQLSIMASSTQNILFQRIPLQSISIHWRFFGQGASWSSWCLVVENHHAATRPFDSKDRRLPSAGTNAIGIWSQSKVHHLAQRCLIFHALQALAVDGDWRHFRTSLVANMTYTTSYCGMKCVGICGERKLCQQKFHLPKAKSSFSPKQRQDPLANGFKWMVIQ